MQTRLRSIFNQCKSDSLQANDSEFTSLILTDYNKLQVACVLGLVQYVLKFLSSGELKADDVKIAGQKTPLELAVFHDHPLIAEILLATGAKNNNLAASSNSSSSLASSAPISYALIRSLILWHCNLPEKNQQTLLDLLAPCFYSDEIQPALCKEITQFIRYAQVQKKMLLANYLLEVAVKIKAQFTDVPQNPSSLNSLTSSDFEKIMQTLSTLNTEAITKQFANEDETGFYQLLINSNFKPNAYLQAFAKSNRQTVESFNKKYWNTLSQAILLSIPKLWGELAETKLIEMFFQSLTPQTQYDLIKTNLAFFFNEPTEEQIQHRLKHYQFSNKVNRFERMPKDMQFHILSFFTTSDLRNYTQVSHSCERIATDPQGKRYTLILKTSHQLHLINQAIKLLNDELQFHEMAQGQKITNAKRAMLFSSLVCVTLIAVSIYETNNAAVKTTQAHNDYTHNCGWPEVDCGPGEYHGSLCTQICDEYNSSSHASLGWGLGGIGGSILALIISTTYFIRISQQNTPAINTKNFKNTAREATIAKLKDIFSKTDLAEADLNQSFLLLKTHLENSKNKFELELTMQKSLYEPEKTIVVAENNDVRIDIPATEISVTPLDQDSPESSSSASAQSKNATSHYWRRSFLTNNKFASNTEMELPLLRDEQGITDGSEASEFFDLENGVKISPGIY